MARKSIFDIASASLNMANETDRIIKMAFDFITEFKKLCAQLQKEDVIVYLRQAKDMMEKDQELQEMIGEFKVIGISPELMTVQNGKHKVEVKVR